MTQPVPDRLHAALAATNAALNPRLAYALQWEYRVLVAAPGPPVKIDCEFVDPEESGVLPKQLVGLLLWPGPSGCIAVPQPGTIVRVGFVNGDPSKPAVVGLDPSGTPSLVMLDGAPGPFVARVGDTVNVTITAAEILAATMVAGANPVTITLPLQCQGTIASGSTKVQCP